MPETFTVVAIIAAYNEEDIIEEVVRALIADGVGVYVIDNGSTDATAARVGRYVGRGVIGIERFPEAGAASAATEFAWRHLLRRKEALSRELRADWFIHHDADEFRETPWTGVGLRDGIERVDAPGYNAIDFAVLNFRPTEDDAGGADVREAFRYYEPGQDWDRQQVKCWKNTGGPVDLVSSGGHDAQFPQRRVFPVRFLLRHYPIRSQAHGTRKVFRERLPRFATDERGEGWHVQYDGFHEGVSFVRRPETLIRYDGDAVRLALILRHRDVERLEQELEARQAAYAELKQGFDRLERHLRAQDSELERLRPCVAQQEAQLEELRRHLKVQDEELTRLRVSVDAPASTLRPRATRDDAGRNDQ